MVSTPSPSPRSGRARRNQPACGCLQERISPRRGGCRLVSGHHGAKRTPVSVPLGTRPYITASGCIWSKGEEEPWLGLDAQEAPLQSIATLGKAQGMSRHWHHAPKHGEVLQTPTAEHGRAEPHQSTWDQHAAKQAPLAKVAVAE